jgi:hypothetical protein
MDDPGGAVNICALNSGNGRTTRITDNRSPSITFAGMDFLGGKTVFYSTVDHNQDIWMVQFKSNKRS